jgi:hypothetical protein
MDYTYAKLKMQEEIINPYEFDLKFKLMLHSLGVTSSDETGRFKDMDTYLEDITIAYLKYQREINGMKIHGNQMA